MSFSLRFTTMFLLGITLASSRIRAREITYRERLEAQESIERVYYSHQIDARRSFEEAVPPRVLQDKVRTYLQESLALEKFWHTSITDSLLQAEVSRIVTQTRSPGRLGELFDALGRDPELIRECLARPVLADRLSRNFFAFDEVVHSPELDSAQALRAALATGTLSPFSDRPNRSVEEWNAENQSDAAAGSPGWEADRMRIPAAGDVSRGVRRIVMSSDELQRHSKRLPLRIGEPGAIEEERERYLIRVVLARGASSLRLATYVIPKRSWDDWWRQVRLELDAASIGASISPPGVSTQGTSTLIATDTHRASEIPPGESRAVGHAFADAIEPERAPKHSGISDEQNALRLEPGADPTALDTAGSPPLCPGDDTWVNGTQDDMPEPRSGNVAVWTGSLLLVWGGVGDQALDTGGRYDPATDTWTPMSRIGAPTPRVDAAAVWSGSSMIVWGGQNADLGCCTFFNTGARYDPAVDTWTPISALNAPDQRAGATAVWTGTEMIVWGGQHLDRLDTGGRYNPSTNTWLSTTQVGTPSARFQHTAIWTGSRMVIWGGALGSSTPFNTGAIYNPGTDTWTASSTHKAPTGRFSHSAVWTGTEMIVWGGGTSTGVTNSGGRYNPVTDGWTAMSLTGAPSARNFHSAAWTGSRMIVWGGGTDTVARLDTGGQYDPASNSWSPTSTIGAPTPRYAAISAWTGNQMLVWGGIGISLSGQDIEFNTGGRYDPVLNVWTPTSTGPGPSPRASHGLVWTGSRAVVWGGFDGLQVLGTGGRYDPALDAWTPTSLLNAPTARNSQATVWTGDEMIVWGGAYENGFYNTGARYDPIADSWSPTSTSGAPTARYFHAGIWTGHHMVVWGGSEDSTTLVTTGGRYNPSTDSWQPTSLSGAPEGSWDFSTIWTGSSMIVWGGESAAGMLLDSGGRYDPIADAWSPTSPAGAPTPRHSHSAVWTGNRMIIWGGLDGLGTTGGGLYDPIADSWSALSTTLAPVSRWRHSAAWTGNRMLIWGGTKFELAENQSPYLDTGGRYDPVTDSWEPTSTSGAPSRRSSAKSVWTGDSLFVWGGLGWYYSLSTGGLYHLVVPKTFYQDSDGDGFGNSGATTLACSVPADFVANATDCSDADGSVWSTPTEALDLRWTDPATLVWSPPASPGADQIRYDVLRSPTPSNFNAAAVCAATDTPNATLTEPSVPSLQQTLYYLARAENNCPAGSGPLGSGTNGAARSGLACP